MNIYQVLQVAVHQAYKRDGFFAAIRLVIKIHNVVAMVRTVYSFVPTQKIQQLITGPQSIAIEVEEQNEEIQDLRKFQIVLAPFYEGEEMTTEKVKRFIESLNRCFPNYSIDPERELLIQVRTRKIQMIIRGEDAYISDTTKVMGIYTAYDQRIRKIIEYRSDRQKMQKDFPYQRQMFDCFKSWYYKITEPPPLQNKDLCPL